MTDILVIGAGIIGMLTARELRAAGASVTLLERGEVGREASWAGGGILSPLCPWQAPDSLTALVKWSQEHYPALARELLAETGIDPEWTASGLLILDTDGQADARVWSIHHQSRLTELNGRAVRECEPALADTLARAVWLPDVAQIRSPRLLQALKKSLLLRGVDVREHTEVTDFVLAPAAATEMRHIVGVDTKKGRFLADKIVVAGGAWSARLLRGLGLYLPVTPVRGQMIVIQAPPGLLSRIVVKDELYLIPRRDGRVLVGSTLEHAGFDKMTTEAGLHILRKFAMSLVPVLRNYTVEHQWAGLRPGSPQGIPFIGAHPRLKGLWVNAGHFRNGLVLAPASAQLLTNIMLDTHPIVPSEPYWLNTMQA